MSCEFTLGQMCVRVCAAREEKKTFKEQPSSVHLLLMKIETGFRLFYMCKKCGLIRTVHTYLCLKCSNFQKYLSTEEIAATIQHIKHN